MSECRPIHEVALGHASDLGPGEFRYMMLPHCYPFPNGWVVGPVSMADTPSRLVAHRASRSARVRRRTAIFQLVLSAAIGLAGEACAQTTGPQPPQNATAMYDGQGPGMAFIAAGQSLFVDPTSGSWGSSYGPCRKITNSGPATRMISYGSQQAWLSVRAPFANLGTGSSTPNMFTDGTASEVVCCRPMQVPLCIGAASGETSVSLAYDSYGDNQSVSASCVGANGGHYTDIKTYQCGQTGSGAAADGAWSFVSDVASCTPSWRQVFEGCTASCGGGSYQYYNYDTNYCPASTPYYSYAGSCNTQSCCTPHWTCGACNGSGVKSCSDGCGNVQNQGCTLALVGGSNCNPPPGCQWDQNSCGGPPTPCPTAWRSWGAFPNGCQEITYANFNPDGQTTAYCYAYE